MFHKAALFLAILGVAPLITSEVRDAHLTRLDVLGDRPPLDRQGPSICGGSGCCLLVVAKFDDAELGKILEAISKASGVPIAAELDVNLSQKISISEGNLAIDDLLTVILRRLDLTWDLQGDYVVVRRAGWDL